MCIADSVSVHIALILLPVYMKIKSDPLSLFLKMAIAIERVHEMNTHRVANT